MKFASSYGSFKDTERTRHNIRALCETCEDDPSTVANIFKYPSSNLIMIDNRLVSQFINILLALIQNYSVIRLLSKPARRTDTIYQLRSFFCIRSGFFSGSRHVPDEISIPILIVSIPPR